ncbi:ATP-dependent DNA ligase [Pseudomonas cannabina]|uniref:DNA ligase (ATP) n=3 Tax=Pseudomonas syringae group TaxID=136849 RepID=A0A3M3R860_PSECA|nr:MULTISPECIES: ATP-dependent DNA ligase [Pseudomonas syringae group]KPB70590.1 ATP-dependent DNA ligase [Pseudomonas syringae pv. maculicola]KPW22105.1 ATP-dependent DNA ligase [Pseudomonas cannabina pv. alisalensis]MBM0141271.1 ATP-dependent DNA ligase [Pseudomonas cannabina pv. alisalensis]QHE98658.1 ATP-dependent DNA ligase [Pseudomonas syringae pv. maculicola str. ES4326]QQN20877.1 ATP-dependent DNA ligase [Pseudomonas cannabina pv. alisalensis]
MKAFAELYAQLDATTSSNAKLAAMRDYFEKAAPEDAAWAVYFLSGGRPRQLVPTRILREQAMTLASLPEWLFEESYQAVGDLAETLSLLLPQADHSNDEGLATWLEDKLLPLRGLPPEELAERLPMFWSQLDRSSLMVCIKLITGSFRVGVSKLLVTRALAALADIDSKRVAQRLVGYTDLSHRPSAERYLKLIAPESEDEHAQRGGQPYPFFLAHSMQQPVDQFDALLGPAENWQVEWKWDGIRAQLVKRDGRLWIWSRGEELVTDRFPELHSLAHCLPDGTVIDGEIVVWKAPEANADDDAAFALNNDVPQAAPSVQPFALLQQRIGRKTLGKKILTDIPVVVLAYDLLEWQGDDWRSRPQHERRAQLETLIERCQSEVLMPSPVLSGTDWLDLATQREASRSLGVEGMMLKARDSLYGVGRTKDMGVWWKWKIDPFSVDAVLIYAQRGHGRRASLYSDYTFAVWDGPPEASERTLVPFAKAYSGLTDEEMRKVDAIVRKTTVEKFGPVSSVTPTLVFELGFEGIALSKRHKSGIAVRFPRMLRWRQDKPVAEADSLVTLQDLLN